MSISHWFRLCFVALIALAAGAPEAEAQRGGGGRFSLEYEGELTGGVTGIRSSFTTAGGAFMIELPAVVASYPTVRLVRRSGIPDRPAQLEVGTGADAFSVEFTHPDLPVAYIAQRGSVRITQIGDGRVTGEFAVVATPAGGGAGRSLTIRGRFEASQR